MSNYSKTEDVVKLIQLVNKYKNKNDTGIFSQICYQFINKHNKYVYLLLIPIVAGISIFFHQSLPVFVVQIIIWGVSISTPFIIGYIFFISFYEALTIIEIKEKIIEVSELSNLNE